MRQPGNPFFKLHQWGFCSDDIQTVSVPMSTMNIKLIMQQRESVKKSEDFEKKREVWLTVACKFLLSFKEASNWVEGLKDDFRSFRRGKKTISFALIL